MAKIVQNSRYGLVLNGHEYGQYWFPCEELYTRKSPVNTDLAKTKCCPFLCILSDVEAENGHCRRNSSRSPKELKFIWPILMVTSYTEQGHT